ncbi:MAG: DMT family transporter [Clostridia bacterium]|nr:DMT family transporter [Clostridia bacterium]MBR4444149.1 DMT family transporter [Clostridia bacterium]
MGYLYLGLVALLFSFGGTCVKLIRPFFTPSMITFLRFLVGVFWLLGLKLLRRQRFRADFAPALKAKWGWLLFGAAVKYLAYITENTALSMGVSYGNILTRPVQIILHTVLGVCVLRERMNAVKWAGIALCVAGILLITWNGTPPERLLSDNIFLTLLYAASGIFAGLFVFAQKKTADGMDILDSNLVMFAAAAVMSFCAPLSQGETLPAAAPNLPCAAAILLFGFITGIGFYLNAKAIPLVSFQMVALMQSTTVFFSLAWGILFFGETVSGWIVAGTLLFVAGIVSMQMNTANAPAGSPPGK